MRALICLVALLVLSLVVVPQAMAQSDTTQQAQPAVKIKRSQLLVPPKNADGTIIVTPFLEDPVMWARDEQQNFYGKMSSTLKAVRGPNAMTAGWTLMLLSFAYGIFHAAGPGHGKAVISTWLLATESELRRGVLISFMSAIIQALTAIVLVSVLFLVVASVGSTARNLAGVLESASYALIALMGVYLIWTGLRLLAARRALAAPAPALAGVTTRQSIGLSDFASFEPMTPRLRLRAHPSSGGPRSQRRFLTGQGLLAGLCRRHQAVHRGDPRAAVRQWAWPVLGGHRLHLRDGHRHLHYRVEHCRHRRLRQEAGRPADARQLRAH